MKRFEYWVEGKKRSALLVPNSKLSDILEKEGYNTETMLVTLDSKLVIPSKKIPPGRIELFRVVSGG